MESHFAVDASIDEGVLSEAGEHSQAEVPSTDDALSFDARRPASALMEMQDQQLEVRIVMGFTQNCTALLGRVLRVMVMQ
jgi:hypothetical protein